jgi:DNA polymerase (family 10)
MKMEPERLTQRLLTAISEDGLDILAHPTGRLINQREGMVFDMERVMETAKGNRVALELNSYPDRLDLNDAHCRMAVDRGVTIAIDTDSHSVADMSNILFGVATARRGWVTKASVLNALSLEALLKRLS